MSITTSAAKKKTLVMPVFSVYTLLTYIEADRIISIFRHRQSHKENFFCRLLFKYACSVSQVAFICTLPTVMLKPAKLKTMN